MRLNTPAVRPPIITHEGASARQINSLQQLRRSVSSCLLWEDEFYEDGMTIAERIEGLAALVKPEAVAALAFDARTKMKLRHVPLLLCRCLAKIGKLHAGTLAGVIQRPDELTEFLAIYWKDGKRPLAAQVKKGLAEAFTKFNAYGLAKYNQGGAIKLRDVLFLCHAKPKDHEQAALWKLLVNGNLPTPDTWEVSISACKTEEDKKWQWSRLLAENKLGALALLRNLRNMKDAKVDAHAVAEALDKIKAERVLPFRFIAAAQHAPGMEEWLERAMYRCLQGAEKLPGLTTLLIDVSGSMESDLSHRSDLSRIDAASALAILLREIGEHVEVFTFSNELVQIPARRGFALRDAIVNSQAHNGTYLGAALGKIMLNGDPGRLIVITDEQSHDAVPDHPGYLINVASAQNGVGYGRYVHIDGFSESVVDFITNYERAEKPAVSTVPLSGSAGAHAQD